jgi:hypothetical protein
MLIGGPEEGREDRLAKATISCPSRRSLAPQERVELVPFFQDWAKNHCRTAIINTVKTCEYIRLIEDSKYREQAERDIESSARGTLETVGMMLVQCTVVVEPNEPTGIFATPEILARWESYRKTISTAEVSKLKAEHTDQEEKQHAKADHDKVVQELDESKKQGAAVIKQTTEIKLRELALELKRIEATLAIQEQQETSNKDSRIMAIQEEMALRAQQAQLQRIRREAELVQEREHKAKELADLKRLQESETLAHRQSLLAEERLVAEKELEVMRLKQQLNAVEVELRRSKGEVNALNIQQEVLARGAHEFKMRDMLFSSLPAIVEQASKPIERIGDIRMISVSGGQGTEPTPQANLGSLLASASSLPIVREMFRFLNEVEGPGGQASDAKSDAKSETPNSQATASGSFS